MHTHVKRYTYVITYTTLLSAQYTKWQTKKLLSLPSDSKFFSSTNDSMAIYVEEENEGCEVSRDYSCSRGDQSVEAEEYANHA